MTLAARMSPLPRTDLQQAGLVLKKRRRASEGWRSECIFFAFHMHEYL
jgi:hypothetical protein